MRAADPEKAVRDFGRRVGEERARHNWTQAQLAEEAGVSLRYIQQIEAGGENLTIKSTVEIANVLGVSVAALFTAPKTKRPARGRPRGTSTAAPAKPHRRL